MNYIGVIDGNNFFVSCERLFRPDLIGKPCIVMSGNDGCVVARSQEVKDIGVPMGVPIFQIKDIIKDNEIATFSSNFALYRDVSNRVFSVVKELLPTREIYSIDEAFFSIKARSREELMASLCDIKREVEKRVGIPVSIGVSLTKTQAKYANRLAKKSGGVAVLDTADWDRLSPEIKLGDIWGVGGNLTRRYTNAMILTVQDLRDTSRSRIETLFGLPGVRLLDELSGNPVFRVGDNTSEQKSIISSRSFEKSVKDITVIKDAVAHHVRQISAELRQLKLKTYQIGVTIKPGRHGDFVLRGGTIISHIDIPNNSSAQLLKVAIKAVEQIFEADVPYKKVGVFASDLVSDLFEQESLFTETDNTDTSVIDSVIDSLNIKFGRDKIVIGKQTKSSDWRPKIEKLSPSYTTRWSDIARVKAN